jgi:DMSO/TMAO reductase YedYZ molybdopterin-dependent catalytic subunit
MTYGRRCLALRATAGALAGLLAAAVALGVAQLAAGLAGPLSSPVIAVGGVAVNLTPAPVKDFAITHFGSHDKQVLVAGILVVLAVFAAAVGVLTMRRFAWGYAGLAVFAGLGVAAAVTRPAATPADGLPALAGASVASVALHVMIRAASRPATPAGGPGTTPAGGEPAATLQAPAAAGASPQAESRLPGRPERRRFLLLGAGTATAAAVTGVAGQLLLQRFNVSALRTAIRLPRPVRPAAAVPAGAQLPVPGITSFITSNSSFYRVDIDLVLPQISPDTWQLRVHGMVRKELVISFEELLRRPLTEADITLTCVSNQVGGDLAGNARWLGASLARLLREAGVETGADQILSSAAADGMSISTPLAAVIDDADAMLAVGMNGQPLPIAHGFPARMMVPGLYGYVSGTKWVTDLNITTFAAQQAYWTQRGYAARAPIKTMSRIDVPKPLAQIPAGRTAVAGVAWAPTRGIDAVQVRADGGPWHQATLAAVPSVDTWRQWVWEWDASPGSHQLEVRATDGTGVTQTSRQVMPLPNGASGWDTTVVIVT